MDTGFLSDFARAAGVGGIAFGVLLIIFRDVIKKQIFSSLTKDQSFRIFRLLLVLTWSIALVGVVGWLSMQHLGDDKISEGVSIHSPLYSPKDAENRFFSVVVNNNSGSNLVVRKVSYSRGRSSNMMTMNSICCPFCGGDTGFTIAAFSFETEPSTARTVILPTSIAGETEQQFAAKVSFSHGCKYPTEAQLELPVQVAVPMRTTIALRVSFANIRKNQSMEDLEVVNEDVAGLKTIANADTVCLILDTDIAGQLKTCQPERALLDSGQWFL